MNKLIESMLPIRAWLSPSYGTCGVVYPLPWSGNVFAIAFHVSLLEVCWEPVQVLRKNASHVNVKLFYNKALMEK